MATASGLEGAALLLQPTFELLTRHVETIMQQFCCGVNRCVV
jgi:hypothetical protein